MITCLYFLFLFYSFHVQLLKEYTETVVMILDWNRSCHDHEVMKWQWPKRKTKIRNCDDSTNSLDKRVTTPKKISSIKETKTDICCFRKGCP